MKLILVRHAETEWNLEGIIQGHSDSSLTCRGLRETSVLLAAFSASEYQIEHVYASPLGRAWQMGQSLAEHFRCSLTAEPALKEQAFGQFEGMPLELLRQKHPNDANALFRLDAEYCPPGGSHWRMLLSELCVFYKTWKILHHINKQYVLCLTGMSVRALWQFLKKGLSIVSLAMLTPMQVILLST